MSNPTLIDPCEVDPHRVQPGMVEDGLLYLQLPNGDLHKITAYTRLKETHFTNDLTPYPVTTGFLVEYDGGVVTLPPYEEAPQKLLLSQEIRVGIGATENFPGYRHPYTVVEILSLNQIVVQEDTVHHISGNFRAGNVVWKAERNPDGERSLLKFRKGVGWTGAASRIPFVVGTRDYYESPEG